MAKKAPRLRGKPENPRKFKKKTSPLIIDKVEYVDYKDIELLSRFMSDRAKIRNMRVTGNDRQQQLEIANAIKIAREMALLPYAKRVASSGRGRPSRDDRRGGGDREGRHNGEADLELDMTLEGDVDVDVEIDDVDDVDVTIEETMETPA